MQNRRQRKIMDLHSLYFVCISTKLAKDIHISLNSERFWRQSLYWGNVKFRQSAIISVSSDVRFTNHSGNAIKVEPFERPMYLKVLPHLLSQPDNNAKLVNLSNWKSFKFQGIVFILFSFILKTNHPFASVNSQSLQRSQVRGKKTKLWQFHKIKICRYFKFPIPMKGKSVIFVVIHKILRLSNWKSFKVSRSGTSIEWSHFGCQVSNTFFPFCFWILLVLAVCFRTLVALAACFAAALLCRYSARRTRQSSKIIVLISIKFWGMLLGSFNSFSSEEIISLYCDNS